MKKALLALAIVASLTSQAFATDKWLDVNGSGTADSGVTAGSTVTWNTATSQWNTDSSGSGGTLSGWTSGTGDRAFFAAGGDATVAYTVNVPSALTTGAVFVEEGTITKTGAALSVQTINITNGAFFINASGALTVAAGGTTTLNGTGATYGNANPSTAGSFFGNSAGNANMQIVLNGGGTLSANGGSTAIVTILDGAGANKITGSGPLVIGGNGTLRIANTGGNNYTGDTIINGRLQISTVANVLPSTTDMTINSGGEFNYQNSQTINSLAGSGNLTGTSPNVLTIAGSNSTTYSGVWSGNGRINVNKSGGTGTFTIDGVNTATGRFTLTNGTVTVNASKSLGGSTLDLEVNGGVLNLNNAAQSIEGLAGTGGTINLASGHMLTVDPISSGTPINNIYSGTIAGDGGITKSNVISGATVRTETLSGNNTYNGNTFVKGGILSVQHANALGSTVGYTEVNKVGSVEAELLFTTAAGSVTISEPLRISGPGASDNGAIAVTAGATPTISGPVTLIGNSTITVSGTSSVLYNNANAFTSSANENLTLQGGSGTSPLGIGTISGAISLGTGSLTKLQGGTWILSNAAGNTYSGGTVIGNSTTAGGTLVVTNTSGSGTGSGDISIGNGTFTGTLNVGNGGAGGSVSGNITFNNTSNTSNVNFNRSTDSTYGGSISGSNGNVTKSGAGVLTLTNASTYTGTTTINGGTLNVANVTGSATGSGAVTINSGGTLAGTGAISGPVVVNTGGKVSPGNSPGVLNVGAITFNAGSTFQYEVDSNAAPAASADLINANGNLTIAAAGALLNISYAGTNLLSKLTLISYAGTWDGNVFDTYADDSVVTLGGNQYVINYNDLTGGVNFGGGIYGDGLNPHFVTLTAVPEAGAFVGGCLICGILGFVAASRKRLKRRNAGNLAANLAS